MALKVTLAKKGYTMSNRRVDAHAITSKAECARRCYEWAQCKGFSWADAYASSSAKDVARCMYSKYLKNFRATAFTSGSTSWDASIRDTATYNNGINKGADWYTLDSGSILNGCY